MIVLHRDRLGRRIKERQELKMMKQITMKNVILALFSFLLVAVLGGCSSDLEKRIGDLERRVAELENGGVASNRSQPAAAPAIQAVNNDAASLVVPDGPLPVFSFVQTSHDFGEIQEGEVVNHTFAFTNNGESPLIIESAKASCGCTVPNWPREPIAVGATGEIEVSFNSKGKPGIQNKTVTITANTNPTLTKLYIKSNVQKAASETASADGPVKK